MKLVYYTAPWCHPCKTFGPILETFAKRLGFELERIDIQDHPEKLPANVLGIPTVIMYTAGEEVARFTGAKSAPELEVWTAAAGV